MKGLKLWLNRHPEVRVVVIDVLAKFKSLTLPKGQQRSAYDADYAALEALQSLAQERGIAIIVLHHMRKADS